MMDTIRIDSGEKHIGIEDHDGNIKGELVFNPSDILFAEKFYNLMEEFREKLTDYRTRMAAAEAVTGTTKDGVPVNAEERIEVLKETCTYVRGRIDYLFGDGTSQLLFGDSYNLDSFSQFFEAITPFIKNARVKMVEKYASKKGKK